jgi:hypothetical protein
MYGQTIAEWVQTRKSAMNSHERVLYFLYRKTKGLKMGSNYSGVPRAGNYTDSKRLPSKIDESWELRDLYYDVGDKTRNEDR